MQLGCLERGRRQSREGSKAPVSGVAVVHQPEVPRICRSARREAPVSPKAGPFGYLQLGGSRDGLRWSSRRLPRTASALNSFGPQTVSSFSVRLARSISQK